MFAPYNPNLRLQQAPAQAPADDWHQQWGGTPEASGPGGGNVPFQAGAQPPPTDWRAALGMTGPYSSFNDPKVPDSWQPKQDIYGNPLNAPQSSGFNQRAGPGSYIDRSQWNSAPAQPAPQSGGGFTPLSQLGRGLGRLGGALHLPGFGGGNQPPAAPPPAPPQTAPGGANQYEIDPKTGGYYPGNRIMADGSSWMIGIDQAHSRQVSPPGSFDPKSGTGINNPARPMTPAPGGAPGGGGMVLLRAPNGQTKQVPGDQVAHYLARGATRG